MVGVSVPEPEVAEGVGERPGPGLDTGAGPAVVDETSVGIDGEEAAPPECAGPDAPGADLVRRRAAQERPEQRGGPHGGEPGLAVGHGRIRLLCPRPPRHQAACSHKTAKPAGTGGGWLVRLAHPHRVR